MGNRYKRVIGWEKFGGEWWLRMALAHPRLTDVWPGSPSETKPNGERRRVSDEVLSPSDVRKSVSDEEFAEERGLSSRDLRILRQAWALRPGHGTEAGAVAKKEPRGPEMS